MVHYANISAGINRHIELEVTLIELAVARDDVKGAREKRANNAR